MQRLGTPPYMMLTVFYWSSIHEGGQYSALPVPLCAGVQKPSSQYSLSALWRWELSSTALDVQLNYSSAAKTTCSLVRGAPWHRSQAPHNLRRNHSSQRKNVTSLVSSPQRPLWCVRITPLRKVTPPTCPTPCWIIPTVSLKCFLYLDLRLFSPPLIHHLLS